MYQICFPADFFRHRKGKSITVLPNLTQKMRQITKFFNVILNVNQNLILINVTKLKEKKLNFRAICKTFIFCTICKKARFCKNGLVCDKTCVYAKACKLRVFTKKCEFTKIMSLLKSMNSHEKYEFTVKCDVNPQRDSK